MQFAAVSIAVLGIASACGSSESARPTTNSVADQSSAPSEQSAPAPSAVHAPNTPTPPTKPQPPTTPTAPTPQPPPSPTPPQGHDFGEQAHKLFRVAACGGDKAIPDGFDPAIVSRHCKRIGAAVSAYNKRWLSKAKPFLAHLVPKDIPNEVVYPFGGGDLTSALATYPNAVAVTTLSLEAAGDVRAIDRLTQTQLRKDLRVVGHDVGRLFRSAHSTTKSLQRASHSRLPGTLMFALVALHIHGMEPLSLRYFDIRPNGTVHYLTTKELEGKLASGPQANDKRNGEHALRHKKIQVWKKQQAAFANVEVTFRPQGGGAERVYRHIVANLDNNHLGSDRRVLSHLERKGRVAVMTKAASFLLWLDEFSLVREYLIANLAWMISDASGIPPHIAQAAGFEQIPYGTFNAPYFVRGPARVRRDFIRLWKTNPRRSLPFRFGYPDKNKASHLLITRRVK